MGFPEERVRMAYISKNGNKEQVINYLLAEDEENMGEESV